MKPMRDFREIRWSKSNQLTACIYSSACSLTQQLGSAAQAAPWSEMGWLRLFLVKFGLNPAISNQDSACYLPWSCVDMSTFKLPAPVPVTTDPAIVNNQGPGPDWGLFFF